MYKKLIKRAIDLTVAVILVPVWAILFLIVAPLIYLNDRGPVFYNAPRLGKNGKEFIMYKFRTMKVNAPDLRNSEIKPIKWCK